MSAEFQQKILFIKDVEQIVGKDRTTLRRWWRNGNFPKPVKLNNAILIWHHEVVERWISQSLQINEL